MVQLLLTTAVATAFVLWLFPEARTAVRRRLPRLLSYAGLGLLALLVATGRLHWILGLLLGAVVLGRRFWRARGASHGNQNTGHGLGSGRALSEAQAYAVLGLANGADREQIVAAHRRLMQRLHPDRGGSDYLAARINEAKAQLLRGRR